MAALFTALNHLFAWIGPLIFTMIYYSEQMLKTELGFWVIPLAVVSGVAVWFLLHRMNETIETGVGMERQFAREIKFLIPLVMVFGIVILLSLQVANLHFVMLMILGANMLAIPFRLLAFRFSARHMREMAAIRSESSLSDIAAEITRK